MDMLLKKILGKSLAIMAATSFLYSFANIAGVSLAADSGCVTCHLDKEMLKKTAAAQAGKKSAMQSGAG